MKRFIIEDLYNIAEAMYNEIVDSHRNEVMFVGFYEDAISVIKELMMFDEVMPYSIEIEPEELDWYDKEYYVTLDNNLELWVQPAYHVDNEIYYGSETDVLFIADDCNSAILRRIKAEEVIEVTYGLDGYDFEDEECNSCCGECSCHMEHTSECEDEECDEHLSPCDSSMTTRVAVDEEGRIRGFEKTWESEANGMRYFSSYTHYSNDQDMLRKLMDNFDIKIK